MAGAGSRGTISVVASPAPKALAAEALFEYALRTLGRSSLTALELRSRLSRRAARPEDVGEVVDRLTRAGYLSDESVAESYSYFRKEYERLGERRVLRELMRRGVAETVAREAVQQTYRHSDEAGLIRERLERKLGEKYAETRIENPKQVARLFRDLVRAGFSSDKIVEALRGISSDGEWLDAFADHSDDEVFD